MCLSAILEIYPTHKRQRAGTHGRSLNLRLCKQQTHMSEGDTILHLQSGESAIRDNKANPPYSLFTKGGNMGIIG